MGKPYISLSTGCLTGKARVEADSHETPYPPGTNKETLLSAIRHDQRLQRTHPPFNPTLDPPDLGTTVSDTPSSYDVTVSGLDDDPAPVVPPNELCTKRTCTRRK